MTRGIVLISLVPSIHNDNFFLQLGYSISSGLEVGLYSGHLSLMVIDRLLVDLEIHFLLKKNLL